MDTIINVSCGHQQCDIDSLKCKSQMQQKRDGSEGLEVLDGSTKCEPNPQKTVSEEVDEPTHDDVSQKTENASPVIELIHELQLNDQTVSFISK